MASKKIVPYSDVHASKYVRDQVFSERNIRQHIGKHLDLRSRLRLAASHKLTWNTMQPQDDSTAFPKPARQGAVESGLNHVLRNPRLQQYMGTFLSQEDRTSVMNINPETRKGGGPTKFLNEGMAHRQMTMNALGTGPTPWEGAAAVKAIIKAQIKTGFKDPPCRERGELLRAVQYRSKLWHEGHKKQKPMPYLDDGRHVMI